MAEVFCMLPEDVRDVAKLERKNISTAWSEEGLMDSLKNGSYLMLVAKDGAKTIGYIGSYIAVDELNITNLVVDKDYRRRGTGQKLLEAAIESGKERGIVSVYLEVRCSNSAAVSLYEKCGFESVGRRKNYYDNPREDAFIMCLRL